MLDSRAPACSVAPPPNDRVLVCRCHAIPVGPPANDRRAHSRHFSTVQIYPSHHALAQNMASSLANQDGLGIPQQTSRPNH